MHIKQFEQLCRQLAQHEAVVAPAETDAGWQDLARRLDLELPAPLSSDYPSRQCGDLPGPHGPLSASSALAIVPPGPMH
jgi:hypothetical protein